MAPYPQTGLTYAFSTSVDNKRLSGTITSFYGNYYQNLVYRDARLHVRRFGANPSEWPAEFNIREYPSCPTR